MELHGNTDFEPNPQGSRYRTRLFTQTLLGRGSWAAEGVLCGKIGSEVRSGRIIYIHSRGEKPEVEKPAGQGWGALEGGAQLGGTQMMPSPTPFPASVPPP